MPKTKFVDAQVRTFSCPRSVVGLSLSKKAFVSCLIRGTKRFAKQSASVGGQAAREFAFNRLQASISLALIDAIEFFVFPFGSECHRPSAISPKPIRPMAMETA